MSANFGCISLEEILLIKPRNGLYKSKKFQGQGNRWVKMKEVYGNDFFLNQDTEFIDVTDDEIEKFGCMSGDLLFGRTSLILEGIGDCLLVGDVLDVPIFESNLFRIRLDLEKADSLFYYYFFKSSAGRALIQTIAKQTAATSITSTDLIKLDVPYPPLNIQSIIAQNINVFDEKITLNRQINQTLESMAQTIFKSWFVDFEPVKAKIAALKSGEDTEGVTRAAMRAISGKTDDELDKMEGGQPEDYARLKTTAELFPAAMQDSELGEVPEGWEIKQLDQIAHYQNGLALQKFRPENEDEYLPVLKIAQLKKGFADGIEKASVNIKQECIVDDGDVVFSWSGSLMIDIWCGGKVALNQHLFKVTSEKYPKWFYYYWTKQHLSGFQRIAAAKAVTMGHIKREHLSSALCATSSSQIIENLSKIMDGLVEKSTEVRLENIMLQNLRDILLPKLLSGELSVDAVELAEEN